MSGRQADAEYLLLILREEMGPGMPSQVETKTGGCLLGAGVTVLYPECSRLPGQYEVCRPGSVGAMCENEPQVCVLLSLTTPSKMRRSKRLVKFNVMVN